MIKIVLAVTNDIVTDNRLHKIGSTLIENGYKVTIVGRKRSKYSSLIDRPYRTRRFCLWFNKSFLFYANYNIRLFFYLLKVPVDIIVSNDLDTLLGCWLASKLRRKVLVFDSHELFIEVPELVGRPLVKKIWHIKERLLLPSVVLGYTVSKSIQEYFKTNYDKEFQLVRNVGSFRYDGAFKKIDSEYIIIYQGTVNKGRGLELMLEAMKFLDNAKLWVVGIGDVWTELKELATDLGVANKVDFIGRVELSELWGFTKKAYIGISLEEDLGLNYRYALPNKIFDYIQARIPVVVSDLPEMSRIVKSYGVGSILKDRSPKGLAKAIENLTVDYNSKDTLRQNLELAARELCWQREEEKVVKLYRQAFELMQGNNV